LPDDASRLADDSGQGIVEYALILALASVGIMVSLMFLRDSIGSTFDWTSARIDAASTSSGGVSGSTVGSGTGTPNGGNGHGGGNGQGNSGNGNGNGGPNGGNNGQSGAGNNGNGNGNGGSR
jgi:Flp pilus assembly pilin Flp